jgi:hypothetical protein
MMPSDQSTSTRAQDRALVFVSKQITNLQSFQMKSSNESRKRSLCGEKKDPHVMFKQKWLGRAHETL